MRSNRNVALERVVSQLREHRADIKKFGVKRLGVFGSVASNHATRRSDIDFLVDFDRKSFDAYMGLKLFLQDLFGRRVDLVIRSALKPALRSSVLREVVYVEKL